MTKPVNFTLTEGDLVLKGSYSAPANGHDRVTITEIDLNGKALTHHELHFGPHHDEAMAQALVGLIQAGGAGGVVGTQSGNSLSLTEGSLTFAATISTEGHGAHQHEVVTLTSLTVGSVTDTFHHGIELVGQPAGAFVTEVSNHPPSSGGSASGSGNGN